jgi:hypothetical protein
MQDGKVCRNCGVYKKFSEFNLNKACKDGYRMDCKTCLNKKVRERKHAIGKCLPKKPVEYTETHKKCTKCNQWREYSEFPKDRNQCKRCRNNYKLELKEKNPAYAERQIQATKEWGKTEEGKAVIKRLSAKFRKTEKGIAKEKEYQIAYNQTKERKQRNKQQQMEYRKSEKYQIWLYSEKGRQKIHTANFKRRSYKHKVVFKPHERLEILERDKWTCQMCGIRVHDRHTGNWNTPDKAHIDHIKPISKGGNSDPSNLQVLCRTCNQSKADKNEEQL